MNKEISKILDYCKEYTEELLEETKDFSPFAAFIDNEGFLNPIEYEGNKKENPLSGDVIDTLRKSCLDEFNTGSIVAYGVVYEVKMQLDLDSPAIDAIAIDIIHQTEKNTPVYYFQYTIKDEAVNFSEVFAVKRG